MFDDDVQYLPARQLVHYPFWKDLTSIFIVNVMQTGIQISNKILEVL